MSEKKLKTINVKLDSETKSKIETLAYLQGVKLQDLCTELSNSVGSTVKLLQTLLNSTGLG